MLNYDYEKYTFKAFDKFDKVTDVKYLDVVRYGYEEKKGIRVETKNEHVFFVRNYWYDYEKHDEDDKFKFECFERDVYRLMFLSEWTKDREVFIDKHYLTEERFEEIKKQKQAVLDAYLKEHGAAGVSDFEYRALESSFALLRHKSRSELDNEFSEMGGEFLSEMLYFDRMKKASSLIGFEQNALELYGEPVDIEESQIDDMADMPISFGDSYQ